MTTETLVAFHGKQETKDFYLTRIARHREMDHLVRGTGWDAAKQIGCGIGCTLEKYDHGAYETELGIPRALARLEDGLFESLPENLAMAWPERFLSAIRPGADLSLVLSRWFVWMLVDPTDGVIQFAKTKRARGSIEKVASLYSRKVAGEDISSKEWASAAYAAYAAAAAYAADAAYAAYAAAAADAADAADAAAAYAAAYAAEVSDAAEVCEAAEAAAAEVSAAEVSAAARSKARVRQADKLIELLGAS